MDYGKLSNEITHKVCCIHVVLYSELQSLIEGNEHELKGCSFGLFDHKGSPRNKKVSQHIPES